METENNEVNAKVEGEVVHGSGLHSEVDLIEATEEAFDEPAEEEQVDYSHFSKAQLVEALQALASETNFKKIDATLREIKHQYDELHAKDRKRALEKFIQEGGVEEDFELKPDDTDVAIEATIKAIRDRKHAYIKQLEENKLDNQRKKEELLEKLRVLTDGESSDHTFEQLKEIQRQWRATGPIPGPQSRNIWASYHALLDRFYDNQSIYFELKELDRRKNLEAKIELCARAEKLAAQDRINDAVKDLNELHTEFKHLGPVPREEKEKIWQRFKAASDAVYARRDAYLSQLQEELVRNLESKNSLAEEVQRFATFQSDRIKEWNQLNKEILEVQKRWEQIGGLPKAKAKEVNRKFWSAFKTFYANKNHFFRKLDEEREANLKLKQELVAKALNLKESQDWEATSNELRIIQQQWKDIGPVPEKFRDKIFADFKAACDYFFDSRRQQQGKEDLEQTENLNLKTAICTELENFAKEGGATQEILAEIQDRYNKIGFVPRKDINSLRNRYQAAVDKFIQSISGLNENEKSRVAITAQLADLKDDPNADKRIYQREQQLRKKIQELENDIALWKNNLEFFSKSKQAEQLRAEFNQKIDDATAQLKEFKQQLKLLRSAGQNF